MASPDDPLLVEADALAALVPAEFTAARNARAKELRGEDRALADRVATLKKPSAAAWLVNQLVRHRRERIDELLELGAELRAAQADLDASALTLLARQRRALVQAVVRDASDLAEELGDPVRSGVLDEVGETLQAGMTDASASTAVRSGRLVRALEAIGTEVDLDGALMAGTADAEDDSTRTSGRGSGGGAPAARVDEVAAARRAKAIRQAEQRVEAAEREADAASDRLDEARAAQERRVAERDELAAELERVRAEFEAAEHEARELERGIRPLEREAADARRRADDAQDELDELQAADG